jgi:hypothetical protein
MVVTYGVALDVGLASVTQTNVQNLQAAFYDSVKAFVSTQYQITQTEIKYRIGVGEELSVAIWVETQGMSDVSLAVPQNTSYLIQKRSGTAGRRNRGRLYLPGVAEGNVDHKGLLTSATVSTINTALSGWLAKFATTIGFVDSMVILHSSGISATPAPTVVNALVVDPVVATQRRRLRR